MSTVTAWLLTYLLHSTLLLGGAWLVRVAFRERRLGLQEALIRAALVGGFVTASLQLGLGLQPAGGVFTVPDEPRAAPTAPAPKVVFGPLPEVLAELRTGAEASEPARGWALPSTNSWRPLLVTLWAGIALVALARLGVAAVRLRRMLSPRHPIPAAALASQAAALAAGLGLRRPVPVSTAPQLEVPLATGVLRPEVCLPTRALEELEGDQQVALCAHELAHVARQDPAWILVARVVEALAPLQPLNGWGRRRLQDLAECLSDDLAVAASGRPDRLARSLVDVASWTVADAVPFPAAAAGALSARSRLGHRVERLMDPLRALERPGRLLLPLAALAVLGTALVSPVVLGSSVTEAEAAVAPAAPAAPEAPEAPAAPEAPQAPEAPGAPQAPEAPGTPEAPEESEAARELEELTERIEKRAELHGAEMEKVGAEIERLVEANMPPAEEMERLGREIEKAAETLAQARMAEREGGKPPSDEALAQARAEMEAAREQLHAATRELRIPEGELRRLQEQASEMARAVALSPDERRRLQELTEQVIEESMPDMDELQREMKEISRTLSRESMEAIRESMRIMRETLRETMPRMREEARAARDVARVVHEQERMAMREARRVSREAQRASRAARESSQTLDDAEQSHLEDVAEAPPES